MDSYFDSAITQRMDKAIRASKWKLVGQSPGGWDLQLPNAGLFPTAQFQVSDEWVTFEAAGVRPAVRRSERGPGSRGPGTRGPGTRGPGSRARLPLTAQLPDLMPEFLAVSGQLPGGLKLALDETGDTVQLSAELPSGVEFDVEQRLGEWARACQMTQDELRDLGNQIRRTAAETARQSTSEPGSDATSEVEVVQMGNESAETPANASGGAGVNGRVAAADGGLSQSEQWLSEQWLSVAQSCGWPTTQHDSSQVRFKLDHAGSRLAILARDGGSQVRLSVVLTGDGRDVPVVREARRRLLLRANRVVRMVRAVENAPGRFRWEFVWTQTPGERELHDALGSLAVAARLTADVFQCLSHPAVAVEYSERMKHG